MASLHYKEYGSGKSVVLLHGFCESGEMWDTIVEQLREEFHLLIPDLPGFGQSPLPAGHFSIDDIGETIVTWLEELNISTCSMIGHSLGGYVALAVAKQKPELLDRFGLFHSTALEDSAEKKVTRNRTIDFIKKFGPVVFAESFVPSLFYIENRQLVKEQVVKVVEIASRVSETSLVKYTEAMRDRRDRTDVLKSFERPILFIAGEYDTAVPLDKIYAQIDLPKKPVVHVLKDTGHMGMFEKKEYTQEILMDFLS